MKILVLVKEVPDMGRVQFDSERGTINRASAEAELNPFDRNALQSAVNLRNEIESRGGSCTVTALTMGPPRAERTMRDVYARGADRCVLMTDRRFGGADTLATARTLAGAVRALGGYDLIVCGEKTVDGDTAQVGPEVAELLGIPHCCYVEEITLHSEGAEVRTGEICGREQVREINLPALVGVTKNIAAPRLPTLRRKLESLEMELQMLSYDDIAPWAAEDKVGAKGSPTRVAKIEVPPQEKTEPILFDRYEDFSPLLRQLVGGVL